jgi:uncharacterized protein (TIGR03066 family)
MKRILALLLIICAAAPALVQAEPDQKQQLVGAWKFEDEKEKREVRYDFREDGNFSVVLRQGGEVLRRIEGTWDVVDGNLSTTYEFDSLRQVVPGHRESDKLLRLDSSLFTVASANGDHRTYWRVKEE